MSSSASGVQSAHPYDTQPEPLHDTAPVTRATLAAASVLGLFALVLGLFFGPQHQQLGYAVGGDVDLANRIRELPGGGDGYRSLAAAEVTAEAITWAGIGYLGDLPAGAAPGPNTPFELGSITKTFTGSLFADAIERGEVSAQDALERHIPELAGTAAGRVTLASLAQHTSGLPPLGATAAGAALPTLIFNDNPYAETDVGALVQDAAEASVTPEQGLVYSNFGVSLLGEALVRASASGDYPSLVRERITEPLGMANTVFAANESDVPDGALSGHHPNGLPAPRWVGSGYLPAGSSTFTTIADLAKWAQAQINGTAPGRAALNPTTEWEEGLSIGWGWLTSEVPGEPTVTWHNGQTAGFSSILRIDLQAGTALVMLGNSTTDVELLAEELVTGERFDRMSTAEAIIFWTMAVIGMGLTVVAMHRAIRAKSLLPIVADLVWAVFGLALMWHSGPWMQVGSWLWAIPVAITAAAAAVGVCRVASGLPLLPAKQAWASWLSVVLALLTSAFVVAMF